MVVRKGWQLAAAAALACVGACGRTATPQLSTSNARADGGEGGSQSRGSASTSIAGSSDQLTSAASSASTGPSNSETSGSSANSTSVTTGSSTPSTSTLASQDPTVAMYHKHINRDGFYIDGAFTKAKLEGATLHLDPTFSGTGIGGEVRASPLYLETGFAGNPTFYVADESNNVYAFDGATGALLKTVNLGTGLSGEPCGELHHVGIRGTPAIDEGTGVMVLDAATGGTSVAKHTIYGLAVSDLSTAWSLDVSTLTSGSNSFAPANENQRSAVLIVGGVAYVSYGGFFGDCGNYYGWVVGVPVATGMGAQAWATPATQAGIWAPGGLSSDGTAIFAATGNPGSGGTGWSGGYSLVRFQPGPVFSGSTNDYWVAVNDTSDEDLGGSGPLVVNPPGATPYIVQLGKDGYEYLLDISKPLGGAVSPSLGSLKVMNDPIIGGPSWASIAGTTYVAMMGNKNPGAGGSNCPGNSKGQLVVTTANPNSAANPIAMGWCANPMGGGSPIITTSDGTNDAFVWTAGTTLRDDAPGGDGQLHAFELATGARVNSASDTFANVHHFTTPIVVHGRIFVAGDARLYAYKP